MPFAAALSEHPSTAHAVGEVAGQVLEKLGGAPDIAVLFATAKHAEAFSQAAEVVRRVLQPTTLLGCTAVSVLANAREVEDSPAITLWAGRFGPAWPLRLDPSGTLRADPPFLPTALVLVGDPFSFAAEAAFRAIEERWPSLPVIGGMASAARAPGGNRMLLDFELFTSGAVGFFLGPGVEVDAIVSQGCRPIGRPYAVTAADANVVRELGGQPALRRLLELADGELSPEEVTTINRGGLHVGRVIDERKAEFGRGDFLVRNLLGANDQEGSIALADKVEVGETLQFHLRDADTADDDLRAMLTGRTADSALVFTCNGRGASLFTEPHHDAAIVDDYLARPPTSGFFAAGEFGPVGGHNFVHGYTASIALLREKAVDG